MTSKSLQVSRTLLSILANLGWSPLVLLCLAFVFTISLLIVLHTSVNWRSFNGTWMTNKSLQVSRTLLSILANLGWSLLVLLCLAFVFTISLLIVLHTSVNWRSFNGTWMTSKSLQVSRTLLSILANLGWSPLVLLCLAFVFTISLLIVLHTSVNWRSFNGTWMTSKSL